AFILLWIGLAPFSLKYKILKCLTLCLVFLDLSRGPFSQCPFLLVQFIDAGLLFLMKKSLTIRFWECGIEYDFKSNIPGTVQGV
ncbi:MAG: hypothetical protein Q8865_09605, partial [Bacillota bacterium]|nr:hypothetical protein [Bacillota bacterium]